MAKQHAIVAAVEAGERVAYADLLRMDIDQRSQIEEALLATPAGRHWLRENPALSTEQADRLLAHEGDFRQRRRDRTLALVTEKASIEAILAHISAIVAGPSASVLWRRLADEPEQLVRHACTVTAGADALAAEATLHLLALDPLDPFRIGVEGRHQVAAGALTSSASAVRGLAAEFLAEHAPDVLERALEQLQADESERVRGIAWGAALRVNRPATVARATTLLSNESVPVPHRRSALNALGTALPTAQVAELLSYFVVHPDHELAADAASLLYRQHRNPLTAEAARDSPHADVREVAEQLLDPLRGSPAAGGSRPGDPTRTSSDIFADMIRQLEEKADNQTDPTERSS